MKTPPCPSRHLPAILAAVLFLFLTAAPGTVSAYPIDGFDRTGIKRLLHAEKITQGTGTGPRLPKGALLPTEQVQLRLLSSPIDVSRVIQDPDPLLQKKTAALFPNLHESYSLALIDITPGRQPRAALWQSDRRFALGSVGKLAIAAGLFTELQRRFPDSTPKRQELLKTRVVKAGPWIETDHHNVPVYDPGTGAYESRPIRQGDRFSLYEWADHMISASANAAASTLWKELVLMRSLGDAYPPTPEAEALFFSSTPKSKLSQVAAAVVNEPLAAAGIKTDEFHLGSFFTAAGKKLIPGEGNSNGSPIGLLKYLVAMEQGKIVDPWSSLEIKRLMYSTAKRIRYASSPALNGAAVFFKSGSLYKCVAEPGFACKKYMGNKENVMNSVAIVEHPDNRIYLVALMTNVLKKNSAVDHQTLATQIEAIIK